MSGLYEIECHKCGHRWYQDLDDLDDEDLILYKDVDAENLTYRVRCPACHTTNVFTVAEV